MVFEISAIVKRRSEHAGKETDVKKMDNQAAQAESFAALEQTLRQKAEKIAQGMGQRSSECSHAVSPEEMQRKHHELLVHQIELEMQNDELRRAQTELEETRLRYLDLYNLAPVGYCTISKNGLILEANLTAANLLDVTRSDLINQPMSRFIFREDQDVYYMNKQQLFETEKPQAYELRMTKRDGTTFWVHVDANTFKDEDGTQICRAVLSDITERKLGDEKLKAAEDDIFRQNTILTAINHIYEKSLYCKTLDELSKACLEIIESITESKFSFISEIREDGLYYPISLSDTGWEQCSMQDKTGHRRPDASLKIHGLYGSVLLNGKSLLTNDPSNHPDSIGVPEGHTHLTAFLGAPFFREGKVAGMIAVGNREGGYRLEDQDMLEAICPTILEVILRERVEEAFQQSRENALDLVNELRKADKNKNEFLNALSHELRNPLAAISAGIQILDITDDKKQSAKAKEIMKRQMNQLCNLVDDLLDLTRITNNKIVIKKEKVELNQIVLSAMEDYKTFFDEKEIKIELKLDKNHFYIDADPVRLTQIIGNLLHNALKFTETGGETQLEVYQEKNDAVIKVEDNGIGIKPEFLADLFEPFKQADKSLDRHNSGLGLGLSIVKGIAELHGGSVSAASEGLGKGSKFIINLPLSEENLTNEVAK